MAGPIKPPNQTGPGGNRAANGFLPLTRGGGSVNPPNRGMGGDCRGGSYPLGGGGEKIQPPNHAFAVGHSSEDEPPAAREPGKGAVPVNPWTDSGKPAVAMPVADMPRGK